MSATAGALLLWSVYTYLTARIDGDIVAEAIQVQQWLDAPFWVMSYPGQLYGGVLEYPIIAIGELIAPGDVYGFTLVRVLYVPIVGLLMCVSVRRINGDWSLWPLALVAVVSPAIVHSITAVKDLYPFSWLIGAAGVTLLYTQYGGRGRTGWIAVGALLVGLSVYEHPTTVLFAVPMVVAGVVHFSVRGRLALVTLLGFLIGLLPMVIQPDKETSYGTGMPTGPRLIDAFGLNGRSDSWAGGFVPNGWGVQFTDANALAFPVGVQFAINLVIAVLVALAVVVAGRALLSYVRGQPPAGYAFVAVLWGTAAASITVLSMVVRPIFYYGGSLSVLVGVTLVALPSVLARGPRLVVMGVAATLMAITSIGAVLGGSPLFPEAISFKRAQAHEVRAVADAIAASGVPYVYGSYWEVLPVAFASAGRLHPITNVNNRFPLPPDHPERITVAVMSGTTATPLGSSQWPYAADALQIARTLCVEAPRTAPVLPEGVEVYDCPADALLAAGRASSAPSS